MRGTWLLLPLLGDNAGRPDSVHAAFLARCKWTIPVPQRRLFLDLSPPCLGCLRFWPLRRYNTVHRLCAMNGSLPTRALSPSLYPCGCNTSSQHQTAATAPEDESLVCMTRTPSLSIPGEVAQILHMYLPCLAIYNIKLPVGGLMFCCRGRVYRSVRYLMVGKVIRPGTVQIQSRQGVSCISGRPEPGSAVLIT